MSQKTCSSHGTPTKPKNGSIIEREEKHTFRTKGPMNCHNYKKMLFVNDLKETKIWKKTILNTETFALITSGREMGDNTTKTGDI